MRLLLVIFVLFLFSCASTQEMYLGVKDEIPSFIDSSNIVGIDTLSRDVKLIKYRE